MRKSSPRHAAATRMVDDSGEVRPEHPFREYIGAMARQLAQMARSEGEGDEALAIALEQAAQMAITATPAHPEAIAHARQG